MSASDLLRGRSGLKSENLISLLLSHFAPARRAAVICRGAIIRRVFTPARLPPVKVSGEQRETFLVNFAEKANQRRHIEIVKGRAFIPAG